jgi:hypothetical protein
LRIRGIVIRVQPIFFSRNTYILPRLEETAGSAPGAAVARANCRAKRKMENHHDWIQDARRREL